MVRGRGDDIVHVSTSDPDIRNERVTRRYNSIKFNGDLGDSLKDISKWERFGGDGELRYRGHMRWFASLFVKKWHDGPEVTVKG